jgi:EAL domain-containing protein (putative c-di-GMP-specific phosphodiesterase class I)
MSNETTEKSDGTHAQDRRKGVRARTSIGSQEGGTVDTFERALGSLSIHYRPIVSLSGSVFGYDATFGTSEPTLSTLRQLYAAALRLGRVSDLGWQIRAAVAQSPPGENVLVPVDPQELADERLGSNDDPLISAAASVILKISERGSLPVSPDIRARLRRLREQGYRMAFDNFGVGQARLIEIAELTPDFIKIHESLVRGLDHNPGRQRHLAALFGGVFRDLLIRSIADGVETQGERDALAKMGVTLFTSGPWETRHYYNAIPR